MVNVIFNPITEVITCLCIQCVCACAQFEIIHNLPLHNYTHTGTHTLSKKLSLFVHEQEAVMMSCCIIVLLITLTCNRVTTQRKQTRPPWGILLHPLLYFSICTISSVFLRLLTSLLSSLLHSFSLSFSPCVRGRPCPWAAQPLSRFLISMCTESREAVWQSHCLLCAFALSLSCSLFISITLSLKKYAALTPFHWLYQSIMSILKVRT